MRYILASVLSFSFCFASSDTPNWALKETSSGWNADSLVKAYFHNSELQRQWSWEMMGKQALQGNEKILDFGCGDGKITAEISRLLPQGSVTGIDISSQMIQFAKIKFPAYAYPNLEFIRSTSLIFDDTPGQHAYDMICSFCVFHQVAQPLDLLKQLKSHLKPSGKLVLVIPAGKNPEFFKAANEMFSKYQLDAPWKNPPALNVLTMRTIEGCSALLKEAGYHIQSIDMIDTDNPFYDKNELIAWMVGNTTANWSIPLSISPDFFRDLVERMCELDPKIIDDEGRLHFKLSRLHVVAGIESQL